MKQAIVLFLKKDKKIESIRKEYIKDHKKYKPHINLVYPFENINQKELHTHIKNALRNIKPFKISLKGLQKSKKEYRVYLLVNKNKGQVTKLHRKLNSGLLKNFKNKDMPKYVPHLTLGIFKTKKEIDLTINEIKKQNLSFETLIKTIQLLTLRKSGALKSVKSFKLK